MKNDGARFKGQDLGLRVLVGILVAGTVYSAIIISGYLSTRKIETSRNNITMIGLACKVYANNNAYGKAVEPWPPVSFYPRPFSLDPLLLDTAFADLGWPNSLAGTLDERPFNGRSYYYFGYAFQDEKTGLALIDALRDTSTGELDPASPIKTRAGEVHPLREGIESYLNYRKELERQKRTGVIEVGCGTTPPSTIPILIEHPAILGNGGHVLYMDGRVEFISYPGKFPMTEKFIAALELMEPENSLRR